jgi:hypothetical protein
MGSWLYPISSRGGRDFGYWFEYGRGKSKESHPVSYESFRDMVLSEKNRRDEAWVVNANFGAIQPADELYIYTGDGNKGIIGYGKVTGKNQNNQGYREVIFQFNKKRTKELLLSGLVPASLMRSYLPGRKKAVLNLNRYMARIKKLLPWAPEYLKSESLFLSPLKLKPRRSVDIKGRVLKNKRVLAHDTVLQPVATLLKANDFYLGVSSFGRLQIDLVGRHGDDLVLVEAKMIKGNGRDEARAGLGQLLEYSWWFKRLYPKLNLYYHLWLAFSTRPN